MKIGVIYSFKKKIYKNTPINKVDSLYKIFEVIPLCVWCGLWKFHQTANYLPMPFKCTLLSLALMPVLRVCGGFIRVCLGVEKGMDWLKTSNLKEFVCH